MADQSPNTNVKLASFEQKWRFYVLLDDKRRVLDFLYTGPRLLLRILLLFIYRDLVGKLKDFFISGSKIFALMFSLSLESKGPVLDWDLHIDSIVGPKDILEIFA